MLKIQSSEQRAVSHEQFFVEWYEELLSWAMHLTGQKQASAEDLVHDVFIHFTRNRPDLSTIHNIRGYLYRALRNMHLSQVRRAVQVMHVPISIGDYDSAELGLRAAALQIEQQGRQLELINLQVRTDLHHICHYACVRKETSKAGSVLILRFFHGYYPNEIARIMRVPRRAVDEWLRIARREAKLYSSDCRRLKFMGWNAAVDVPPPILNRSADEMVQDLREAIFHARRGGCLNDNLIQRLYLAPEPGLPPSLECATLGHIVSCPRCLNRINEFLGFEPLSERYPLDMLGKDGGDADSSSTDSRPLDKPLDKLKRRHRHLRRAKQSDQHRPHELRIAVNGFFVGSQKIIYQQSELTISINLCEEIRFVELFSDQDLRLMYFEVQNGSDHRACVELSDGRTLEATLSFGGFWPSLQVVYNDPLLGALAETSHIEERSQATGGSFGKSSRKSHAPIGVLGLVPDPRRSTLEAAATRSEPVGRTISGASRLRLFESLGYEPPKITGIRHWSQLLDLRSWLDPTRLGPAKMTVILAALLITAVLLMRARVPAVSAAGLLERASVAEDAVAASRDRAVHQVFNLEKRNAADGAVIERRRIELWRSAAVGNGGTKARRLYDEKGRLIAGEWTRGDGETTLYHKSSAAVGPKRLQSQGAASFASEDIWLIEPSARGFTSLIEKVESASVVEDGNTYVISYQGHDESGPNSSNAGSNAQLLSAVLTLRKGDFHAVAQTLLVRQQDGGLREYRFLETSFDERPINSVAPAVFEPEPELTGAAPAAPAPEDPVEIERRSASRLEAPVAAPARLSAAELAGLEVEARYLLDQVGANLGEQVTVTRTSDGELRLQAIVETDKRKREILGALESLARRSGVKIDLVTVAEALERQKQIASGPVSVNMVDAGQAQIPVYADLRRYFADKLGGQQARAERVEEEINRFADRMQLHADEPLRHAWAMKKLVGAFSQAELQIMEAEALSKWRLMISNHARGYQRETEKLRLELQPIFFPRPPQGEAAAEAEDQAELRDVSDLARVVDQLLELASAHERAISRAFSNYSNRSVVSSIKTDQFWRSLRRAESLAAKIK